MYKEAPIESNFHPMSRSSFSNDLAVYSNLSNQPGLVKKNMPSDKVFVKSRFDYWLYTQTSTPKIKYLVIAQKHFGAKYHIKSPISRALWMRGVIVGEIMNTNHKKGNMKLFWCWRAFHQYCIIFPLNFKVAEKKLYLPKYPTATETEHMNDFLFKLLGLIFYRYS